MARWIIFTWMLLGTSISSFGATSTPTELFASAVAEKDIEALEQLLDQGLSPTQPVSLSQFSVPDFPLNHCINAEFPECVDLLLARDGKISPDSMILVPGWTELVHAAVKSGDVDKLKQYVDAGVNLNDFRFQYPNLIQLAVESEQPRSIRRLIQLNYETPEYSQADILLTVLKAGYTEELVELVRHGWVVTPSTEIAGIVHQALMDKNKALLTLLFENGLEIDDDLSIYPGNLIKMAIDSGDGEQVELAIELGASTQRQNDYTTPPLSYAIEAEQQQIALQLIQLGADVEADSEAFNRPVELAIQKLQVEVFLALRERGAKPDRDMREVCDNAIRFGQFDQSQFCADIGLITDIREHFTPMLFGAIESGNLERVTELVRAGADPSATHEDDYGNLQSSMVTAAAKGHLEVMQFLNSAGVDYFDQSSDGQTALYQAILSGYKDIVTFLYPLIEQQPDPTWIKNTALDRAIVFDEPEIFYSLLTLGAKPNEEHLRATVTYSQLDLYNRIQANFDIPTLQVDNKGNTLFHLLGSNSSYPTPRVSPDTVTLANLLRKQGLDPTTKNQAGQSAINRYFDFGGAKDTDWLYIEWMIGQGVELEPDCCYEKLRTSIENDDLDFARTLLTAGASPSAQGSGEPLLFLAMDAANDAATNLLLEFERSPASLVNAAGETPLHLAAQSGQLELAQRLIDLGVDPDARRSGRVGETALMLALESDQIQLATLLLNTGASATENDRLGKSTLSYLNAAKFPEIAQRIESLTSSSEVALTLELYPSDLRENTEILGLSPNQRLSLRIASQRIELWDEVNQRALRQIGVSGTFSFNRPVLADFLDDERIILAHPGKPLEIRDVYSGNVIELRSIDDSWQRLFNRNPSVSGAALSADRKLLAVSSNAAPLTLYDATTFETLKTWPVRTLEKIKFHQDGRITGLSKDRLITVQQDSEHEPKVFDLYDADSLESAELIVVNDQGLAVAYSSDNSSNTSPGLHLWDVNQGKRIKRHTIAGVTSMALVDTEHFVLGHDDGTLSYWQIDELKELWRENISRREYNIKTITATETHAFATIYEEGLIVVPFSSRTTPIVIPKKSDWGEFSFQLSMLDDEQIIISNGTELELWHWPSQSRKGHTTLDDDLRGYTVNNNGELLVSQKDKLLVFSLPKFKLLKQHTLFETAENAWGCLTRDWSIMAMQPIDDSLLFGCFDSGPHLWGGEDVTELNSDGVGVHNIAVSPNQQYLVAGHYARGTSGVISQYSPDGKNLINSLSVDTETNPQLTAVAISGDYLLTGSESRESMDLWSLSQEKHLGEIHSGEFSQQIWEVDMDQMGQHAISRGNGLIKLWDLSNREFLRLIDPTYEINDTVLSPDGKIIATAYGGVPKVELWEFESGKSIGLIELERPAWRLSFSADSHQLLVSEDHISIFDVRSQQAVHQIVSLEHNPELGFISQDGSVIVGYNTGPFESRTHQVSVFKDGKLTSTKPGHRLLSYDGDSDSFLTEYNQQLWKFFGDQKEMLAGSIPAHAFAAHSNAGAIAAHRESSVVFKPEKAWQLQVDPEPRDAFQSGREIHYNEARDLALYHVEASLQVFDVNTETYLGCVNQTIKEIDQISISDDFKSLQLTNRQSNRYYQLTPDCHELVKTKPITNPQPLYKKSTEDLFKEMDAFANIVALSPSERYLAMAYRDQLRLMDLETGKVSANISQNHEVYQLLFSRDERYLAVALNDNRIHVIDTATEESVAQFLAHLEIESLEFDGDNLVVESRQVLDYELVCSPMCSNQTTEQRAVVEIFDPVTQQRLSIVDTEISEGTPEQFEGQKIVSPYMGQYHGMDTSVYRSKDGNWHATDGTHLKVWRSGQPYELDYSYESRGYETDIRHVSFLKQNQFLIVARRHGELELIDLNLRRKVATLNIYSDDNWLAMDNDGRYDSETPGNLPYAAWIASDNPLTALPVELFLREYFEPRLIPRILNREKFNPVKSVADLNRIQPGTAITAVVPNENEAGSMDVTINVTNTLTENPPHSASGIRELRLFRDGQQVGYAADFSGVKPGRSATKTFKGIRIPTSESDQLEFSAHAFNLDGVKGNTATFKIDRPTTIARKPRAYVVSIGVNEYENASWDLDYAKADASAIADTLTKTVTETGNFESVTKVKLVSGELQPTRARIQALFAKLAGEAIEPALLEGVEGAEQITRVHPDDLVLVSFAGHGYAEAGGQFHLFPYDIGPGNGRAVDEMVLTRTVTSGDLDQWLRNVDAGEFVMIIDACNSAASVEGDDFKPGPMGSKGLGQLAYNKGMKVLAASQAEFVALESAQLKHGLLTYSLVREGIDAGRAREVSSDHQIDTREWLTYGQQRVPELHKQLVTNPASLNLSRGFQAAIQPTREVRVQRPGLFDFSKKTPATINLSP